MKIFRNLFIRISFFLISLVLASCQNSIIQESAIKISYDSRELKPIYYGDKNDKDKEDVEKMIKKLWLGKDLLICQLLILEKKSKLKL